MIRAKILNASAGSGKTYQLAYKYVRDVVERPDLYRNILAVTFTNKATEEMKSRILREIDLLASGRKSAYLASLCKELSLTEATVRRRATEARTRILHDYSRFTVLTIDRFFQRIIRAFIKELGIDLNYNIELETESLLAKSADSLIEEILDDKELERWLTDYAQERIENDRRWDVRDDILSLGAELFKERGKEMIRYGQDKESLRKIVDAMYARSQATKHELAATAEEMLGIMSQAGVGPGDFKGKSRSFAYAIPRYAGGELLAPTATLRKAALDAEEWCGKDSPAAARAIAPELRMRLERLCDIYDDNVSQWNSTDLVRENYRSFALLGDLYRKVNEVCQSENIMVLNETKYVLSRFINGDNAPFIYEKIGNRYERFMIDEFQDTSVKEWENFLPLLLNAMSQSEEISVLIVGDIKQSIYRWRGGDWRLLQSGAAKSLGRDNCLIVPLTSNYRSRPAIVNFNNEIMRRVVDADNACLNAMLAEAHSTHAIGDDTFASLHDTLAQAYTDLSQTPQRSDGGPGYVRVEIYDKRSDAPIIEAIEGAVARGYRYSDILILVRGGNDGLKAARLLFDYKHSRYGSSAEAGFNVMTQDALVLGRSDIVCFIVAVLRLTADQRLSIERAVYNRYLGHNVDTPLSDEEQEFLRRTAQLSPEEAFENIVMRYKLNERLDRIAYLQAMHEQIISFCTNRIADIQLYLKWWDERGSQEKLRVEKGDNTIEITTIHKSKGLEKPVIIIPYCNWKTVPEIRNRPIVWARAEGSGTDGIEDFPVIYKSTMQQSAFSNDYYKELTYNHVDAINLLYVALTRASEELYAFIPENIDRHTSASSPANNIAPLLTAALADMPSMQRSDDGLVFTAGVQSTAAGSEADRTAHAEERFLLDYPTATPRLRVKRSMERYFDNTQKMELAPRNYGILMHRVFEQAASRDDIMLSVERMQSDGIVSAEQCDELRRRIEQAFCQDIVSDWFGGRWTEIRNESDIIIPGKGLIRRPDRVMIADGKAVVVDYKFGAEERKRHLAQVRDYVELLRSMGRYTSVEGYVWYIAESKIVSVEEG